MSSDLIVVVVEDARARAWWSRWGALSVVRDLVAGDQAFLDYVQTLDALEPVRIVPWMCAVVVVDRDRGRVGLVTRGGDLGGLWGMAVHEVIAARWPGWQVEPITDPCALIGAEPRPLTAPTLADVTEQQHAIWTRLAGDADIAAWIAEAGALTVRETLEWTEHPLWLTVRQPDGVTVHDAWADAYDVGRNLMIGPDGVAQVLATRPVRATLEPWDGRFEAGALVDYPRRTLSLWRARPSYPDDVIGGVTAAWPGWRIVHWPDIGAHLDAIEMSRDRLWGPDTRAQLEAWVARVVGERPTGAAVMATVLRNFPAEPGTTIRVADPGHGHGPVEPADTRALFDAWIAAHAPPR